MRTQSLYRGARDFDIAERVVEVAEKYGVAPAQIAIAWLLAKPGVHSPVVGVSKLSSSTAEWPRRDRATRRRRVPGGAPSRSRPARWAVLMEAFDDEPSGSKPRADRCRSVDEGPSSTRARASGSRRTARARPSSSSGSMGHGGNWGHQVPARRSGHRAVLIDGLATVAARATRGRTRISGCVRRGGRNGRDRSNAALVGWSDGACTRWFSRRAPERVAGVFFACNMDRAERRRSSRARSSRAASVAT